MGDKKPIPLVQSEFIGNGQLSPDGKWLAYNSRDFGRLEVYIVAFAPGSGKPPAGKWQISSPGGSQPRWRADTKELFYLAPDRKLMAVDVRATATSFDRGTPKALFEVPSLMRVNEGNVFGYAPSPDGKRFLFTTAAGENGEAPPLTVVVNWLAAVKK